MVPPPDDLGENFPDFDKMTFEEQMAWLESLARRQGVSDDELTTAADLDVPIPEGAVVDEPGYVPFEGSRSARELREATEVQPEQPFTGDEVEEIGLEEVGELVLDHDGEMLPDDVLATQSYDDPMNWLGGLAVRPASDFDLDESLLGFEEEDEFADLDLMAEDQPDQGLEPTIVQGAYPSAQGASSDDFLDGVDPMLWLESLAARQGADAAELLTSADLQIEAPPPDAEIDEPGYVPFEGSRSAREAADSWAAPVGGVDAEASSAGTAPLNRQVEESLDLETEELLAGAESLEWLETLARRQGAREEELLTPASLEVPEVPEDVRVDEPGYVGFEPLAILPPDRAEAVLASGPADGTLAETEIADEGLGWLEDLAAEPSQDFAELLTFGETATLDRQLKTEMHFGEDPLAGISDEDVASAQAQGTLTSEQELAWLKRQARALAEVRETQVGDGFAEDQDFLPAAEPADLPDWLEEIRQTSENVPTVETDATRGPAEVFESAAAVSGDWLTAGLAEGEFSGESEQTAVVALDGDIESLWAEATEGPAGSPEFAMPDSELEAFVAGDYALRELDLLAEALDEEYERRMEGDQTEPEWYARAVAEAAGADAATLPEAGSAEDAALAGMPEWLEEEAPASALDSSVVADHEIPSWLRELEPEAVAAVEGEIPAWLSEDAPSTSGSADDVFPDWLRGAEPGADQAGLEWATGEPAGVVAPGVWASADEPEHRERSAVTEVVSHRPSPPEVPDRRVVAHIPPGALFDQYRERLQKDPDDHPTRLGLARALRSSPETSVASLDQYETLIQSAELLQDVAADLDDMVQQQPDVPRVRRLLGDVYLRRGELQSALNAYRSALDRL